MRPPSIGSTRTMIYRPPQRQLFGGCIACNGSQVWCDSLGEHDNCCTICDHMTAPTDATTTSWTKAAESGR